jgi:hypothetical protein
MLRLWRFAGSRHRCGMKNRMHQHFIRFVPDLAGFMHSIYLISKGLAVEALCMLNFRTL